MAGVISTKVVLAFRAVQAEVIALSDSVKIAECRHLSCCEAHYFGSPDSALTARQEDHRIVVRHLYLFKTSGSSTPE